MLDNFEPKAEKAILISVSNSNNRESVEEHLDELELLASTAGAETIFKVIQDKNKIDPAYFIGKGKAQEIAELAKENEINLIIFDDDLNPTQLRNLEKLFEKKIVDRSGLILDIFASHARTKEAKTQVELAQLQYMLPRLTRAWTHLSKQYGGIGTKGPGETQIETDRRIIRTRISHLKQVLKKLESQHFVKTSRRKNYINATLVGYTNAGKSTLLNKLTNSNVLAENKLFATLDSVTRSLELDKNKKILLSDTVGFIRKLPPHLVASFKTTLNVVKEADIILHIIDISHDFFEDHIKVVDDTLKELGGDKKIQIKVFNKVDALSDKSRIKYVGDKFKNCLFISAQRGIGIQRLKEKLLTIYENSFIEHNLSLKLNQSKIVSKIYELAEILEAVYEEDKIRISYRASSAAYNKIQQLISNNI
ncbi:GTPase HflX [Melioribacteraceae bacterium 4301-Me]|uniref:GTPase HflX n=1 Tax=Pyranulibacter aquaticus TaxID=3163344 RepID=UPI003595F68E